MQDKQQDSNINKDLNIIKEGKELDSSSPKVQAKDILTLDSQKDSRSDSLKLVKKPVTSDTQDTPDLNIINEEKELDSSSPKVQAKDILTLDSQKDSRSNSLKLAKQLAMPGQELEEKAQKHSMSVDKYAQEQLSKYQRKEETRMHLAMCFNRENSLFFTSIFAQLTLIAVSTYQICIKEKLLFNVFFASAFGLLLISTIVVKLFCSEFEKPKSQTADKQSNTIDKLPNKNVELKDTIKSDTKEQPTEHDIEVSQELSISINDMEDFTINEPDYFENIQKIQSKSKKINCVFHFPNRRSVLYLLATLTSLAGIGYGIYDLHANVSSSYGLIAISLCSVLIAATLLLKISESVDFQACTAKMKSAFSAEKTNELGL